MNRMKASIIIQAIDRLSAPAARMGRSMKSMHASMGRLKSQAAALAKFGSAGVGAAGFALKKLTDVAAQYEKYQIMLESLEGSTKSAQKAMSWVSDIASTSTRGLDEIMGGYVRLRTFGMDPTNGTMQSLLDMNARMGGSNETLSGMILAVGQAWTKQKLQGEEALQLIERGVPVWDLLAKRSGKTVQEIMNMSAQGRLGRAAIAALVEEMGKFSAGADAKQAKTWAGMVSMLSDQWQRFANLVMKNGVFDWMKEKLGRFLNMLNTAVRLSM